MILVGNNTLLIKQSTISSLVLKLGCRGYVVHFKYNVHILDSVQGGGMLDGSPYQRICACWKVRAMISSVFFLKHFPHCILGNFFQLTRH